MSNNNDDHNNNIIIIIIIIIIILGYQKTFLYTWLHPLFYGATFSGVSPDSNSDEEYLIISNST